MSIDNSLALHCGAEPTTRADILNVSTPKPSKRHYPLDHGTYLDCVTKELHDVDITVTEERLGLTHDGNRLFGVFEVEKHVGLPLIHQQSNSGVFTKLIGIRNSHDQSFAASLVAGARVFVCDNLMFSGDIGMNRKNTRNIEHELPQLVRDMVGQLFDKWMHQAVQFDAYADTELNNEQAHDLMMLSFRHKCVPGGHMKHVIEYWDNPPHDEFAPRNAWSLFNCFTEVQKRTPSLIPERSMNLHKVFNRHCSGAINRLAQEHQLDYNTHGLSSIEDAEIIT